MNNTLENSHPHGSDAKTHALIAYILMIVGVFTFIPIFVGAIWAMVTRRDSQNTIYYSHYTNAIRAFWWWLFWWVVGGILTIIAIGYLVLFISWLWLLYRIIFGMAKIVSDEAYPL